MTVSATIALIDLVLFMNTNYVYCAVVYLLVLLN